MSNYSLIDPEKRLMLQKELQATDDELKTLEKLIEIQKEKIHSTGGSRNQPSLVIDKFLYLGDLGHAIDANLLLDLSIDNILNVCDCQLDEEISRIRNVKWIETLDDHPQANIREKFDETNAFLLECKKKNEKVLVHCQQGISRSSSIVLAYLMKCDGLSLEKAYRLLLDRRPIISPNYGFLIQLIRYEKEIFQSNNQRELEHNSFNC